MKRTGFTMLFVAIAVIAAWSSVFSGAPPRSAAADSRFDADQVVRGPTATPVAARVAQMSAAASKAAEHEIPSLAPPAGERMAAQPAIDDSPTEDDTIHGSDQTQQQATWRDKYQTERSDDVWTKRMGRDMTDRAASLLHGNMEMENLDCRETVCRMYLEFKRKVDGETFMSSIDDPKAQYVYQSLGGNADEGSEPSPYTYELLVKRPLPAGTLQRPPLPRPTTLVVGNPNSSASGTVASALSEP